jgi:dihydropteroate synthase
VPTSRFQLPLGKRTLVMGILNVTPDSFSDGGDLADPATAVQAGRRMAKEGADILDIGGESTRPGSQAVPLAVEMERVLPVFDQLGKAPPVPLSVDTTKSHVARACLERGARIVNDVSAGRVDPSIVEVAREFDAYLVLMHMQGTPRTMQQNPSYGDVVREVLQFLAERADFAASRGVQRDRIIIDPGIGFGKTLEHNLALLRAVPRLKQLGYPVMIGGSRKAMFKGILGIEDPKQRDGPTAFLTAALAAEGVDIVRVHEVPMNRDAARVGDALRSTTA